MTNVTFLFKKINRFVITIDVKLKLLLLLLLYILKMVIKTHVKFLKLNNTVICFVFI
jgi:hypothetical protein